MTNVKLEEAITKLEKLSYWLDIDDELWDSFTVMEKADHKHMQKEVLSVLKLLKENVSNQTLEYSYKTVIDFLRRSLCVTDFEVMEVDDGIMVVEIFLWGRMSDD